MINSEYMGELVVCHWSVQCDWLIKGDGEKGLSF